MFDWEGLHSKAYQNYMPINGYPEVYNMLDGV